MSQWEWCSVRPSWGSRRLHAMRILRSFWVSLTNGAAIYLMYGGAQQVALLNHLLEQDSRNKSVWFHFVLRAAIPILGIVLELLGSRLAKWVNIGYFVFVGAICSAISIWAWSDYHGRILLLQGLAALVVACADYFLYRRTRSPLAPSPSN